MFAGLLPLALTAVGQSDKSLLTIRQPAPPINVAAWVKGEPVTGFRPGRLYVMEFGFIQCPGCRVAIGHLSHLARTYGDRVDVVSVFIYENPKGTTGTAYIDRVARYINKLGDKVAYKVAVDDEAQTMAKTWYEPAARAASLGLPTAFVIDEGGQIVWIGLPGEVEPVLRDLLQKKFNPELAVAEKYVQSRAIFLIDFETQEKHYDAALKLCDSLLTIQPEQRWYVLKFKILLASDKEKAARYGRTLLEGVCREEESSLAGMAQAITAQSHLPAYRDFTTLNDLAIDATERAVRLSTSDNITAVLLGLQAKALANKGDRAAAARQQRQAIMHFQKDMLPGDDVAVGILGRMEDVLKKYEVGQEKKR